jgi:hypothetical protein
LRNLGLPDELILDLKDLVDERTPPTVQDVVVEPENPGPDEPVRVSARIYSVGSARNTPIFEAWILYTTDNGGTWERVPMDQVPGADRMWTGEIPGQPQGAEVQFSLQAFSVNDEMYIEAMCQATEGIPPAPDQAPPACAEDDYPDICALQLPYDCVFPLSVSEEDLVTYKEDRVAVTPSMDFRNGRVAVRDGRIYLQMNFKDDVTHGTMSPPDLQYYVMGWLNPDKATLERGLDAILKQGGVVIYAMPTLFRECTIYQVLGGGSLDSDATSGTCRAQGPMLEISIPISVVEPNPSRELEFIVVTLSQAGPNMVNLKLRDTSLFTRMRYVQRGYTVE